MYLQGRFSSKPVRRQRVLSRRRGLSLLEVMLAIAILGGALVVIGELVRIGSIAADRAEKISKAQLLADSRLAEVTAGALPLQSVSDAPCEEDPDWTYSIEVGDADRPGLKLVEVTVQQDSNLVAKPLSLKVARWLVDPAFIEELEAAAAAAEEL